MKNVFYILNKYKNSDKVTNNFFVFYNKMNSNNLNKNTNKKIY